MPCAPKPIKSSLLGPQTCWHAWVFKGDAVGMGVLKGAYQKRESERAREGHVSVLSCALLSPLRPDTPRMHAIIIELSAIIRCHFCPSEVFLSGTPVSSSTHSCQSFEMAAKGFIQ